MNRIYQTPAVLLCVLLTAGIVGGCVAPPPVQDFKTEEIVFPQPPDEPRFYFEQSLTSSADVILETKDQRMQRWLTGGIRAGDGMSKPFEVAVHQGRVFVSDTAGRKIHVFDKPGAKYFEVGTGSDGRLVKPMGIATDSNGNLYVMDATQKKVFIYDRDGQFIRKIGDESLYTRPTSLAVSPNGEYVFVVDTGGVKSVNHKIVKLDALTGSVSAEFGSRGSAEGEFNLPKDAAVSSDGLLYVVDSANFRIQALNAKTGQFVSSFGSIGRRPGQFSRPKSVAMDPDGNIYVSDAAFGNFQIFDTDGKLLLAVGSRSSVFEPAKFMLPAGIDVDEDGRVYMVDQYFRKVDVFRPASIAEGAGYFSAPEPAESAEPADK